MELPVPSRAKYNPLLRILSHKRSMEDEKANANSELRYLALELTKIATKKKQTFKAVAAEYMQNVYELQSILKGGSKAHSQLSFKAPIQEPERQKKR